jgi:hypothetical protein
VKESTQFWQDVFNKKLWLESIDATLLWLSIMAFMAIPWYVAAVLIWWQTGKPWWGQ